MIRVFRCAHRYEIVRLEWPRAQGDLAVLSAAGMTTLQLIRLGKRIAVSIRLKSRPDFVSAGEEACDDPTPSPPPWPRALGSIAAETVGGMQLIGAKIETLASP